MAEKIVVRSLEIVTAPVAVGQEMQTTRENRRLAAEPPPPEPQPATQALSLEQEISVLQQFGYSDQDILDLPTDQRTLAANSALAQGVLPDPALAKPPVSVPMAPRGDGSKAARPVPRSLPAWLRRRRDQRTSSQHRSAAEAQEQLGAQAPHAVDQQCEGQDARVHQCAVDALERSDHRDRH